LKLVTEQLIRASCSIGVPGEYVYVTFLTSI